jgi:hypothetical protein
MAGLTKLPLAIFAPVRWWLHILYGNAAISINDPYLKQSIRNRYALANEEQTIWLSIPIHAFNRWVSTAQIGISYQQNWRIKHLQSIQTCYGKAPFFAHYFEDIQKLYSENHNTLFELFESSFSVQCHWLHHPTAPTYSEATPDCDYTKTRDYDFGFSKVLPPYYQVFMDRGMPFRDHLSLLDVIFNCGPESGLYLQQAAVHFGLKDL